MNTISSNASADNQALATFGAGCFWGVQKYFDRLPGVIETAAGYMGGELIEPTYIQVSRGAISASDPGHVEVIQIRFDNEKRSYEKLLEDFFNCHNPTLYYKRQYQSAIFYHNQQQQEKARQQWQLQQQSERWDKPLSTVIEAVTRFWRAEDHHQHYYQQ